NNRHSHKCTDGHAKQPHPKSTPERNRRPFRRFNHDAMALGAPAWFSAAATPWPCSPPRHPSHRKVACGRVGMSDHKANVELRKRSHYATADHLETLDDLQVRLERMAVVADALQAAILETGDPKKIEAAGLF